MFTKKRIIVISSIAAIIVALLLLCLWFFIIKPQNSSQASYSKIKSKPTPTVTSTPSPTLTPTPTLTPIPTKVTSNWPIVLSLDQSESLTVVVNKKHKLPSNYAPPDLVAVDGGWLRSDAAKAYAMMKTAAASTGNLSIISSYRSYQTQPSIYNGYVARDGQALADTYSARPGFSEHQTGLAVDIGGSCALQSCFGDTPTGRWLAENAATYGFIVRYPKGKEAITGYQYEPWHMRYLGNEIAKAVVASGKTLDEFFTKPAGNYQ